MSKYLVSTVETYRVDTEAEATKAIEEAKNDDAYVLGKKVNKEAEERIEYLHRISEHKRKEIPTPIAFERD